MVTLNIKVKTNQIKNNVEINGNVICVSLTSPAEKGKANQELVKYLHRVFRKPVSIVSGFKSKNKRIDIQGIEQEQILEQIRAKS